MNLAMKFKNAHTDNCVVVRRIAMATEKQIMPCRRCDALQQFIQRATHLIHWQSTALYREQCFSRQIGSMIEAQQLEIDRLQISLARTILATHEILLQHSRGEASKIQQDCGSADGGHPP